MSERNPLIDVFMKGVEDVEADKQTPQARAVKEHFAELAYHQTFRARAHQLVGSRPRMITDFERPGPENLLFASRAGAPTAPPSLQVTHALVLDRITCRSQTDDGFDPAGNDEIYLLYSAIPANAPEPLLGRTRSYNGFNRGESRELGARVMYRGAAPTIAYSITVMERDGGGVVDAFGRFVQSVRTFWQEDVLPLLDDAEEVLDGLSTYIPPLDTLTGVVETFIDAFRRAASQVLTWLADFVDFIKRVLGLEHDQVGTAHGVVTPEQLRALEQGGTVPIEHEVQGPRGLGGRYVLSLHVEKSQLKKVTLPDSSARGPALCAADSSLQLLWASTLPSREVNLRSAVDYTDFSQRRIYRDVSSLGRPAACNYRGSLVLARVVRRRNDSYVVVSPLPRRGAGNEVVIEASRGARGVAIAPHNDRLHVVWVTHRPDSRAKYTSTDAHFDGDPVSWAEVETLSMRPASEPALVEHRGRLIAAFVQDDGVVYLMTNSTIAAGDSFLNHVAMLNETNAQRTGVGLASFDGRLYFAWTHAGDGSVHLSVQKHDAESFLFEHRRLNETSVAAPALAPYSSNLYLAWLGTDADRSLNVWPVL